MPPAGFCMLMCAMSRGGKLSGCGKLLSMTLTDGMTCSYKVSAAGEETTKGMLNSVPSSDDFDRAQFGKFVETFAKSAQVPFAELADYLLVVPLHEFDPAQKIPAK